MTITLFVILRLLKKAEVSLKKILQVWHKTEIFRFLTKPQYDNTNKNKQKTHQIFHTFPPNSTKNLLFFTIFFALFCRFFFFWCGDFRKFSVKKRADCGYFWDILLLFYIFLQNFLILKNDLRLIYLQFIYFFIRGKSNHSLGKFSYR